MTRWKLRLVGSCMTFLATIPIVLAIVAGAQQPVVAAACCQECEANYNACMHRCDDFSNIDERNACYDACVVYDVPNFCWNHCIYCNPPAGGGTQYCKECSVEIGWVYSPLCSCWFPTVTNLGCYLVPYSGFCWIT